MQACTNMVVICITFEALMRPTAEMSATNSLIIDQLAEIQYIGQNNLWESLDHSSAY